MSPIEGKVVVITGASSGIGEASARLLADRGAAVVLGARRTDRLDRLVSEIRERGGAAAAFVTDVTRRDDVEYLVGSAVSEFGRLDVLLSNAGISKIGPLRDLDIDGWSAMIDVNLRGVLNGVGAPCRSSIARGRGIS
jgi:NADP-dependent 3-hydroxy acid dehydrogenase YdfG